MSLDKTGRGTIWGRLAGGVERVLNFVLLAILLVMIGSVLTQVASRYALARTPSWPEEVARVSMAWITMLGSAALIRRQGHIAVSTIVDMCPPRVRAALLLIRDLLTLVMAGGLAYYGWALAGIGARRLSPALEIPMFYPYLAIPVGAVLIAVLLLLGRLDGQIGAGSGDVHQ